MSSTEVKRRRLSIKLPHLLWVMLGLLFIASLSTYVVPAGNFAVDGDGNVIGDQFSFLDGNTPVSPVRMLMLIMDGLVESSPIIFLVLAAGAAITVLLASGSIDNILNWAIYKLKDKGLLVLIVCMFVLITYIGGFAGSDALIALVPIGVIFARKLKLDPVVAIGITTFPALIGFGTGPSVYIPQMMIGIAPYSGFGLRVIFMNIFMVVGLFYLLRYVRKITKDESKSIMYNEGWRPNGNVEDLEDEIEAEKLRPSSVIALALFIIQYLVIISYSMYWGDLESLYNFMIVVNIFTVIFIGIVTRTTFDDLGNNFAKGLGAMAFIGFVIGLARVMSLILTEGNILDTIVYYLTLPLMDIDNSIGTIGVSIVVAILNPLVPSATSKAAILIPIIEPIANTLGLTKQVAIQAFQFGDGFTNMVSPVLGWTIGSCVAAGVSFGKWVRWVFPAVLLFLVMGFVILYILTTVGWTGGAV